ncbi:MAG: hypothetical protein CMN78_00895 [Spirochaetales bacterium]|nr:hypothetical protein [Spirochaetales bacterium]
MLKKSVVFGELSAESLRGIAEKVDEVEFKEDEIICKEGDPGDRMYVMISGNATVLQDMGWGQRELKRLETGDIFGEMALISGEKRSATVKALEPAICLQLDKESFLTALDEDPHLAQIVARLLTVRLTTTDRQTADDLMAAHRALILSLANLAETRDPDTGAHLFRTRSYCALLVEKIADHPEYAHDLYDGFVEGIYHVSPLHDIGKVAIPDSILLKPGRLSDDEYEIVKMHTTAGGRSLKLVLEQSPEGIFLMAYNICLYHHERWDGKGYPEQLKGKDIPVEARIMAIADVYDVLLSKRVYKQPMAYTAAYGELRKNSGGQFDPTLIDIMLEHRDEFRQIHERFQDE